MLHSVENNQEKISKISKTSTFFANIRVEFDQAKIKYLIILLILVFFGLTTAFSQKYLNQILQLSGVSLKNTIKTDMASFVTKYLSNVDLFSFIIIVLGMGTFSNELDVNKQVYFTLSRPVSRFNYYLTRSLILTIGTAIVTFVGSLLVYFYATMYFTPVSLEKILITFFMIALLYSSMYAIMIMLSTKFSQGTAGAIGFVIFLVETIIAVLSASYDPLKWLSINALSDNWVKIYQGTISPVDLSTEAFILLLWTIIPLVIGLILYSKRDL